MAQVRPILALVIASVACLTWRCESADPPGVIETSSQSALTREPSETKGPLRLAPPAAWQRLNPQGPALFSPEVSPDGRWVAASGLGGLGLYVVRLQAPASPLLVDPARGGPFGWTASPLGLCFGTPQGPDQIWHPDPGGARLQGRLEDNRATTRPWTVPWDDSLGERLHLGPAGVWWHHPREGTVTWQARGRAPQVVVDADAWGARASTDGRFVAYSTGLLAESWLRVHDASTGVTRELGPGVHPVWLPGRGLVIYARPEGVERRPGFANVTGSELWIYDGHTGENRALTATPDLAEMEPEVTPSGDAVILVDWRGGGLWRAPLWGGGRP